MSLSGSLECCDVDKDWGTKEREEDFFTTTITAHKVYTHGVFWKLNAKGVLHSPFCASVSLLCCPSLLISSSSLSNPALSFSNTLCLALEPKGQVDTNTSSEQATSNFKTSFSCPVCVWFICPRTEVVRRVDLMTGTRWWSQTEQSQLWREWVLVYYGSNN